MPFALGNIAFQALSLAVLGAFCWMIYEFRTQVAECFKNAVNFSRTEGLPAGNRQLYNSFLAIAMTLGALSVGLAAVKAAAWRLGTDTGIAVAGRWKLAEVTGTVGFDAIPSWVASVAAVAVALVTVCVMLVEVGVLKTVGAITLSPKFADDIIRTKKNWLAVISMFTVPLGAVWTGVNPVRDRCVMYVFVLVLVILIVLFVAHTLRGFVKQKVSLLVWFLYLCTVEIFPVCAVVLAATKSV